MISSRPPTVSQPLGVGTIFCDRRPVLRSIPHSDRPHKLAPQWEGPYVVSQVIEPGTYYLEEADGTPLPNAWNVDHLRKFYP
jgi:hypothetical protein